MLMVIQFVSKEVNCFLLLLKSCKNGVIDFLRQGDEVLTAGQRIHMKNQALFSSKGKKLKCRLLQFLFGT